MILKKFKNQQNDSVEIGFVVLPLWRREVICEAFRNVGGPYLISLLSEHCLYGHLFMLFTFLSMNPKLNNKKSKMTSQKEGDEGNKRIKNCNFLFIFAVLIIEDGCTK